MSEFDLKPEDLKRRVLKRWQCDKCKHTHLTWESINHQCSNKECDSNSFTLIQNISVTPVTTGYHTEITYDNLGSLDEMSQEEFDRTENDRDTEKLEKARR